MSQIFWSSSQRVSSKIFWVNFELETNFEPWNFRESLAKARARIFRTFCNNIPRNVNEPKLSKLKLFRAQRVNFELEPTCKLSWVTSFSFRIFRSNFSFEFCVWIFCSNFSFAFFVQVFPFKFFIRVFHSSFRLNFLLKFFVRVVRSKRKMRTKIFSFTHF